MTSDAVLHTLLNLVPSTTLLDELARRLAAAQGQPAAPLLSSPHPRLGRPMFELAAAVGAPGRPGRRVASRRRARSIVR
jgi:hypothetical protein